MAKQVGMRTAFIVWNNPTIDYIYKHNEQTGEIELDENGNKIILGHNDTMLTGKSPSEICQIVVDTWCATKPGRTAACVYCISASGNHHLHIVTECSSNDKFYFTTLKKLYGQNFHIEPTRGQKKDVEDYILKQGKFEEKGEIIVSKYQSGEIKGAQGSRNDLQSYANMIEKDGLTPIEIFRNNINSRRYEKIIKQHYFDYRNKNTPLVRNVEVIWHVGTTGTGKSYEITMLEDKNPGSVYFVSDYENGGFDNYSGEEILCLEEFRGQLKYSTLLIVLDKYKRDLHCRYCNCLGLWSQVHITSPFFPDEVYKKMQVDDVDAMDQLLRRITYVDYHYKKDGHYWKCRIPSPEYTNREIAEAYANTDYALDRKNTYDMGVI